MFYVCVIHTVRVNVNITKYKAILNLLTHVCQLYNKLRYTQTFYQSVDILKQNKREYRTYSSGIREQDSILKLNIKYECLG